MLHSKGLFLSMLNTKARELNAHVSVIKVPSSVLTYRVHYIAFLGDNPGNPYLNSEKKTSVRKERDLS